MIPQLEHLEERLCPSATDLKTFQQQQLPILQAEFSTLVPVVQANLQGELNAVENVVKSLPIAIQLAAAPTLNESQAFINAFPVLADVWFGQQVQSFELQLLLQNNMPQQNTQQINNGGGIVLQTGTGGQTTPTVGPIPTTGPAPTMTGTSFSNAATRSARMGVGMYVTTNTLTLK
jgi:hypothetical protein